jgi:hypothetical protein
MFGAFQGVGNFFGMPAEEMSATKLYGVEWTVSPANCPAALSKANITLAGFETTDRKDFL